MTDVLVILVTLAFFAVCAAYIHFCDRIIGPDVALSSVPATDTVTPGSPTETVRAA